MSNISKIAETIWKRDKGRCRICDRKVYHRSNVMWAKVTRYYIGMYMGHLHHINKDQKDNTLLNVVLLCPQCHKGVHAIDHGVEYVCMMESMFKQKLPSLHDWENIRDSSENKKAYKKLCEGYYQQYTDECEEMDSYKKEERAVYLDEKAIAEKRKVYRKEGT